MLGQILLRPLFRMLLDVYFIFVHEIYVVGAAGERKRHEFQVDSSLFIRI